MKFSFDMLPLCRPYAKNADYLELGEDWYFKVNGNKVWLCKGYFMDGASIPRPFWPIVGSNWNPDLWAGAMSHDWAYLVHNLTRSEADECLFQLIRQAGVGLARARTIWIAVRAFGAIPYSNSKQDKRNLAELRNMIAARPDSAKFFV